MLTGDNAQLAIGAMALIGTLTGLVLGIIRLVASSAEKAGQAHVDGFRTGVDEQRSKYERDIDGIREAFKREMADMEQRHQGELHDLRVEVAALRALVLKMIPRLDPDHVAATLEDMAELGLGAGTVVIPPDPKLPGDGELGD